MQPIETLRQVGKMLRETREDIRLPGEPLDENQNLIVAAEQLDQLAKSLETIAGAPDQDKVRLVFELLGRDLDAPATQQSAAEELSRRIRHLNDMDP